MNSGHYYETTLELIWQATLKKCKSTDSQPQPVSRILDVGGNVGYYSLLSASMGPNFAIDTFEPNEKNRIRFCESLALNNWTSEYNAVGEVRQGRGPWANSYSLGVSDQTGMIKFVENFKNPGAGRFQRSPGASADDPNSLPVVTLDDFAKDQGWLNADGTATTDSPPSFEIMKVDVEHHETQVLLGARQLFQSKLVRNIFMELSKIAYRNGPAKMRESLETLVSSGYKLVGQGQMHGPDNDIEWKHDETLLTSLLTRLGEKDVLHLNLWWSLDDVKPSVVLKATI